ncbi:NAD-dependent epimerase/dehydratase family protein [Amylibacter sp. IMCC11727]|uniref:NAD-dependent epimerase/dehydratase family protein n=1 Tax=Amylibacter sp. IMCC11727 TaxID=3039851 RepID=UPI00244DC378|nr:NAD-dependent epimerase/dehydratase family protein [Amylibacter sp. IMCC11727]WGI22253.1 GDP-mannose 4,6-dehydratase [Amylibacter sp. IMCC11727]
MRKILITGSAGFIGFHLAQLMLAQGWQVLGVDCLSDYYDVNLKKRRHAMLSQNEGFASLEVDIREFDALEAPVMEFAPDVIVHLAAQAGVRYSIENPRAYMETNVMGTFNIMELARELKVDHLLMASTSSVYGANEEMPFDETEKVDTQMTLYAATKKANENMGHSYSHLWGLPVTMFRFFTVYGPWGRPDMALFKFVKNGLEGKPIDVFNHGDMERDFTYVVDLVRAIGLLVDAVPPQVDAREDWTPLDGDSLSPAAPFRVINIGNSDKVRLLDFVEEIEAAIGMKVERNYMDMQPGDVPATWANCDLLKQLVGYTPETNVREGVRAFVDWYRDYYNV